MADVQPAATAASFTTHVLKDGDSFLVANAYGDIEGDSDGLFHDDTRLLSLCRLRIAGARPEMLSAAVTRDNVFFVAHLTNRPLPPLGIGAMPSGLLHVARTRFLSGNRLYERLCVRNYGLQPARVPLQIGYGADFRDMFEVRGSVRAARGEMLPTRVDAAGLVFGYRGLDGRVRESAITFSRRPARLDADGVEFLLELAPGATDELFIEVGLVPHEPPTLSRYRDAAAHARRRMRARQRRGARVRSAGPLFSDWLQRSRADLALLTSDLSTGPYPYAGIPWFSTPFGRDAVITALQVLWLNPGMARGVLAFLADHQARDASAFLDSAPGKILHETRKGEMAALRELPFGLYYGGVDTTPLFVLLAGAYARRSGDLAFIDSLWPALCAATAWIERVCDANPYGLLDYSRGRSSGLANQGWKDSHDSVFHADGRLAEGPIALVEVQGYAFAALQAMAALAVRRGDDADAARWQARAARLQTAVEERFWMPERGYYGIAVDGEGALCRVRASNPGHLLYVGLPAPERAAQVAAQLLAPAFASGWGLRTLAVGEARFNPMSYHNGSVWPHDTALCAAGIARIDRDGALRLLRAMSEAAIHFEMRLPELFCGFPRKHGAMPVSYPVACLPQAWAAGAAFMLLQACLGVEIDGGSGEIRIDRPRLPLGVDQVALRGLAVGGYSVDLLFQRSGRHVLAFTEGADAARVPVRLRGG
ncbi:glycogen debranching N-terminal domain-containing protein [Cognatiluteimonas weifangensis]|uniref:Amylo-alpha-1,6-glucosidase n=1 Tax=Cognatiluteimonas weifangensis TaxID=2303539 RepID=A0A372DKX8_9GAMM|nr:glycogen debranching N-terminal domain-containing protein [Luteimonas weifangensis]RFP60169.1 amylo-alpha-1,6-glucosidase [Luteimonas weifangensis]